MRTTRHSVAANRIWLYALFLFVFQLLFVSARAQFRQIYGDSSAAEQVTGMSFLTPSTGFVSFTGHAGFTSDSGHTFTRRDVLYSNTNYNGYSVTLTFGFSARGVLAFSKDSLLLYGDYGTEPSILFSADGGQTWKLVFHKPINGGASGFNGGITDMEFPGNGSTGFAIHNEEVLKTTDRGQHWSTVVGVPDGIMRKLSFPASATGYAIGGEKLFKTTNSGSTWSQVTLPVNGSGSNFNNVFFTSVNNGFVTDYEQHTFFKTTDGGSTWKQMSDAGLISILANDIYFLNDSTGFFAPAYSYSVYKTTDSGKTWEPCKQAPKYQYLYYGLNALSFYNNNIGWAGGLANYLTLTTTGGSPTLPTAYFKVDTSDLANVYYVRLNNYSKTGYQYKWYRNDTLISTDYNASYIHYIHQAHDNIKLIVSNGTDADTAQQDIYYEVRPLPAVTGFSPATGSNGTVVMIYGSNFTNVTSVSFGGVPATSFTVVSSEQIKAIVGAGATGNVMVTVNNGTAGTLPGFVYTAPPSLPAPVVTSFAPLSGPVGTTVTLSGSNFNTSPSGNIVYFGMAKAVVSSASATQLVCTVPVGASLQPILVQNTQTHLSRASAKPFGVTFADSTNFTPHSFELGYSIDYSKDGNYPKQISAGDVDGDGKTDIIASVSRNYRDSVVVYRNTGTGDAFQFDAGTGMPFLGYSAPALGDLDGDGKPDFVCVTNEAYVFVSRNISTPGSPASESRIVVPTEAGTQQAKLADMDGDGRPDMVIAAYNNAVSVVRNTSTAGSLSFAEHLDLKTGDVVKSVAVGDLDGDGKPDIIASNYNVQMPSLFSYFKNNSTKGNLLFGARTDIASLPTVSTANTIYMHDVDGDGKLDVIVTCYKTYVVYRNISANGSIAFETGKEFDLASIAGGDYMENLNGDSKPDFITSDEGLRYLDNASTPGNLVYNLAVGLQATYPGVRDSRSSVSADFDGDGKQDIVLGSIGNPSNYIMVLKNTVGKTIPFTACKNNSAIIQSDMTGDTYQWQQNAGKGFSNITDNSNFSGTATNTLTLSNTPASWNGYTYRCVTGGRFSTSYLLTVNTAFAPHVVMSTQDTATVCPGTQITFTAHSTNTGDYPNFEWQRNGADIRDDGVYYIITEDSTSTLYSFNFNDSDAIRVIVRGTDACGNATYDTSQVIFTSVSGGGLPTAKITASKSSICTGESVTFTAAVTNSGKHPTYDWYVGAYIAESGVDDSVFTTTALRPNGEDDVLLVVTPEVTACNTGQSGSDHINIQVSPSVAPSITISTPVTNVCTGTSVTFTATVTNAGSSPVYQWQVNGVNAGTNSSTFTTNTLRDGDKVSVLFSSTGGACTLQTPVTSNEITISAGTITASAGADQTICAGAGFGVAIGNAATGGNTYSWTSNPPGYSSTEASPVVQPAVSTTYYLKVTNGSCTAQDTVAVKVTQVAANAGADQTICQGSSATIGSAATAGNTYAWTSVPAGFVSGVANPYVTPAAMTTYILKVTNGSCTDMDTVTVQVAPTQALQIPDSVIAICTGKQVSIGPAAQPGYQYSWTSQPAGFSSSVANPVVSPVVSTLYSVTAVSTATGCKETGTVQVTTSDCASDISLYPNPGKNIVHVKLDSLSLQATVLQVVNTNGKIVIQKNLTALLTQVSVTGLQSGLYEFIIRREAKIISRQRVMVMK